MILWKLDVLFAMEQVKNIKIVIVKKKFVQFVMELVMWKFLQIQILQNVLFVAEQAKKIKIVIVPEKFVPHVMVLGQLTRENLNKYDTPTKAIRNLGNILIMRIISLNKISGKLKINRFKIPNYA
ncbi:MAG: hypothetical protein DRJ01_15710 [Bacteroidetes bacterium]|nr:MAG: hypothetical protein DRJ01_15710 [Bacteroidota bacterium]